MSPKNRRNCTKKPDFRLCRDFAERAGRSITKKDLENMHLFTGYKKDVATNAYAILLGKL